MYIRRNASRLVTAVAMCCLAGASMSAWAADPEPGGEAASPFAGTVVNSVVTLVIFLGALYVLRRFAWTPMLDALQKREAFIRDSLAEAKKNRDDAEATLRSYTEKLETARAEASAIVDEGRRDAEAVRQRIQTEARTEADAMLARAKREIGLARDEAIHDIYHRAAEMATAAAARAIRRELSPEEHDRLLASSLEEIKNLGRNGTS